MQMNEPNWLVLSVSGAILMLVVFGGFAALLALLGSRARLLILLLVGVPCLAIAAVVSLSFLSYRSAREVSEQRAIMRVMDVQTVLSEKKEMQLRQALLQERTQEATSAESTEIAESTPSEKPENNTVEPDAESTFSKTDRQQESEIQAERLGYHIEPDETLVTKRDEPPVFDVPIPVGVKTAIVSSGWWVTRDECERDLSKKTRSAISVFNDQLLMSTGGSSAELVHTPAYDWRRSSNRVTEVYIADDTLGAMRRVSLRLEFDKHYVHELEDFWKDTLIARRMTYAGLPALGLFLMLGTIFSHMKLNLETRGAYAFRLRLAAFTAILVIVGCGATAIRYLPWL